MTSAFTRRVAFLVVAALCCGPACTASAAGSISLRFEPLDSTTMATPAGDAHVDVGRIAAESGRTHRRGIVIRRRVGLRLEGAPGTSPSARISVALTQETPGCVVRVDGFTVSALPRTIDTVHRVGTTVVHEVEITIPASVPAGMFLSSLEWLVESD